jgi:hypothetical protein
MVRDINKKMPLWYTNGMLNHVLVRWGLPPSAPTAMPGTTNAAPSAAPAALMQAVPNSQNVIRSQ